MPMVRDGWTVVNPDLPRNLPLGQASLSHESFVGKPRNVFGCPFGMTIDNLWQRGSCRGEYDFRKFADINGSNATVRQDNCTVGYTGYLCAECEDNYNMKDGSCDICEAAEVKTAAFMAFVLLVLFIAFVVVPFMRRDDERRERIDASIKVIRSMSTDVQIFVSVYQVFSAMGQSLRIKFPHNIEVFIQFMRTFVDLDLLAVPGFGCLINSNYYTKLTSALAMPALLQVVIFLYFLRAKYRLRYDGYVPDDELDRRAKAHLREYHAKKSKSSAAEKKDWSHNGILKGSRTGSMESAKAHEAMTAHHDKAFEDPDDPDAEELQLRYKMFSDLSDLKQSAIGQSFVVVFLCYPSVTSKLFGLFVCYDISDETVSDAATQVGVMHENLHMSYLVNDYSITCTDSLYQSVSGVVFGLVVLIPVGIPIFMGVLLWRHREAIATHEGPHHLEGLYSQYRPDCCLWEVYQMLEKVVLVGIITFVDRGSILQVLVGLVMTNCFMLSFLNVRPYLELKSNILSVFGQQILVAAYVTALLLRVDLNGEAFTTDDIGQILLFVNLPMILYLLYDTFTTLKFEVHRAQIDLLRSSLGDIGAHYRCTMPEGVDIHNKLKKDTKGKLMVVGRVLKDEIIIANGQAIDFHHGGPVARLHIKSKGKAGWVSLNDPGTFGKRHFNLVSTQRQKGATSGRITAHIKCDATGVTVTVKEAIKMKKVEQSSFRAGVCVMVRVNGYQQRTPVVELPNVMDPIVSWNGGDGHTLFFKARDEDGDGHIDDIESVVLKLFGVPYMTAEDTRDLIGVCSVQLEDYMDKSEWMIDGSGQDQFVVAEELTVMADGHVEAHSHYYSLREKHASEIDQEALVDVEANTPVETLREKLVDAVQNPLDATFGTVNKVKTVSKTGVSRVTREVMPISSMEELNDTVRGAKAGVSMAGGTAVGAAWGISDLSQTLATQSADLASQSVGRAAELGASGTKTIMNPFYVAAGESVKQVKSAAEFSSDVFAGASAGAKMTKDATAKGVAATGKATKAGVGLTSSLANPVLTGLRDTKDLATSIGGANAKSLTSATKGVTDAAGGMVGGLSGATAKKSPTTPKKSPKTPPTKRTPAGKAQMANPMFLSLSDDESDDDGAIALD